MLCMHQANRISRRTGAYAVQTMKSSQIISKTLSGTHTHSSYQFDPPKPQSPRMNNGVGIMVGAFGVGIIVGAFGMFNWEQPMSKRYAEREYALDDINDCGIFMAIAEKNNNAPVIAAERYVAGLTNSFNIKLMTHHPTDLPKEYYSLKFQGLKGILQQFGRVVVVKRDDEEDEAYRLLKYDDNGRCIVKGPLGRTNFDNSRVDGYSLEYDDLNVITVERDAVHFTPGTPVVCHGLEGDESHLNGKIGAVVEYGEDEIYVSFEDSKLRATYVDRENLSVVFNLPLNDAEFIMPMTPVVCHGLKFDYEKHMNGKIGTVMGIDGDEIYVEFEDPSLPRPAMINTKNLSISFDMPKRYTGQRREE